MPVSSPSYFPPANTAGSVIGITAGQGAIGGNNFLAMSSAGEWTNLDDVIVIGAGSLVAGTPSVRITDTALDGTIILGSRSAVALTTSGNAEAIPEAANIFIGENVVPAAATLANNIFIGQDVGAALNNTATANNVVIGAHACRNIEGTPDFAEMTVIGSFALNNGLGASVASAATQSVVIGNNAMRNALAAGSQFSTSVVIGSGAGNALGSTTNAVLIGNRSGGDASFLTGCIFIGSGTGLSGINSSATIAIGVGQHVGGDRNTLIGNGMGFSGAASFSDTILIGQGAGADGVASNLCIIEQNISGVGVRSCLWSNMEFGDVIIGNSTSANRNFRGTTQPTNALKLVAGGAGSGANPSGGGFFYCSGANNDLHWFKSNGTDVNLSAGGSFGGFANPTASVGLTAVNGAATTAMRSDGAPALSQSIAPTWTGVHSFANGSMLVGTSAAPITISTPTVVNANGIPITINAGVANGGNRPGGDLILSAGTPSGTGGAGSHGIVEIRAAGGTEGTLTVGTFDALLTMNSNIDCIIGAINQNAGGDAQATLQCNNNSGAGNTLGATSTGFTAGNIFASSPAGAFTYHAFLAPHFYVSDNGIPNSMLDGNGNLVSGLGTHAAADTNGFLYLPLLTGDQTGVPANLAGQYADSAPCRLQNNGGIYSLRAYINGGWRSVALV